MPPIWLALIAPNSSEEMLLSALVERLPIWAAVKESVALLFLLNKTISARVKPLTDFVVKAWIWFDDKVPTDDDDKAFSWSEVNAPACATLSALMSDVLRFEIVEVDRFEICASVRLEMIEGMGQTYWKDDGRY